MIVVMSLWRNDADRNLRERALHLLSKTSVNHDVGFLWAVGDCDDDTWGQLRQIMEEFSFKKDIMMIRVDTGIVGEDVDTRRKRSSATATAMFGFLKTYYATQAKYAMLHESDLQSPRDVIDRLLLTGSGQPCAGWPVIDIGQGPQFYDTWAYRYLSGAYFSADAPKPKRRLRIRGFGSVWVAPYSLVAGRVLKHFAIRELCEQWYQEGVDMYCDPLTEIVQPVGLWSPS